MQASILSAKLSHLAKWTEARRRNAEIYDHLLAETSIQKPQSLNHTRHVYHLYVVQVSNREKIQEFMLERGVATGVHYPTALPLLSAYKYLDHKASDFPVASKQMSRILSLPTYAELTEEQIRYIVRTLDEAIDKCS